MLELDHELLKALETGAVIVPSTQRAIALQLAHSAAQLRLGRSVWRSPSICSYTAWLERMAVRGASSGGLPGQLLRGAEEWLHWRDVVRDAAQIAGVEFDHALAESLRRSAQTLHDWQIAIPMLERADTDESRLLARVLRRFEARCAELKRLPAYQLPSLLLGKTPKRSTACAGFIDTTPAQRDLLTSAGAKPLEAARLSAETFSAQAADPNDECALIAEWCRAQLTADPQRRLLIVLPDLATRREVLRRALEHCLTPAAILDPGSADDEAGIAFEGGESLAQFPLVKHAVDTLRLLSGQLEFAAFSTWLRAPFWQAPSEGDRTHLDLWLRNWLQPDVTVTALREQLGTVPTSLQPASLAIQHAIDAGLDLIGHGPRGASQWPRRFAAVLDAFGWPGSRPLASGEHQTRIRFMELLDELAALGTSAGLLSARDAVETLRALTRRIAFEPATGDAAVTVTDALTDPVVRYDGVWVGGLRADVWPRPVQIDPFIPFAAQLDAAIPSSTAAGRLRQAEALLDVWRRSAQQLVLSWPEHGEEGEQLPSALIARVGPASPLPAHTRPTSLHRLARGKAEVETFTDHVGAPWTPTIMLPSGTRSLEYQNLCPFRAYAEMRLNCVPLEVPRPGLDVRDRGRLLHRALEYLWTRLADSEGLRACRDEAREALIAECVDRASRDCFADFTLRQAPRAVDRERRRARRLIAQHCEIEEQRQPFRVHALEARRSLNIGGAMLNVRIDRMDELADGTLAIFDYKTGQPRAQDWLEDRPANPQLLVYLQSAQSPVSALAAVHLTASRVVYRGIADRADRLPKVEGLEGEWPRQIAAWRGYVERLAVEFLAGRAAIDPLGDACRLCHLHGFCRVADAELDIESIRQDD